MKDFDDLEFEVHKTIENINPFEKSTLSGSLSFDSHARMFFDNGYGVSVITGAAAYDNYEIAVLKGDMDTYDLCYSTPVTNDVVPCSTENDVSTIMKQVQEL